MSITNNPTLESNIEKVANWIVNDCDEPITEVEFLLKKLFVEQVEWVKEIDHIRTLNEDITNVYNGVFEYLKNKENKEIETSWIINYLRNNYPKSTYNDIDLTKDSTYDEVFFEMVDDVRVKFLEETQYSLANEIVEQYIESEVK